MVPPPSTGSTSIGGLPPSARRRVLLPEPARRNQERHQLAIAVLTAIGLHLVAFGLLVATSGRMPYPTDLEERLPPIALVFRIEAGPGGGGGGGGEASSEPPSKRAIESVRTREPPPIAPREPLVYEPKEEVETAAPPPVEAPIEPRTGGPEDQKGVLDAPEGLPESAGPGTGGGSGIGEGTGVGEGKGAGIGPGTGGGIGGGAHRLGSGVVPPVVIRRVEPAYTNEALQRKIEGSVVLEIVILEDGTVGTARVVRSLDPGLDQNAIAAAKQWKFVPGKLNGQPVAVIAELVVDFRLY